MAMESSLNRLCYAIYWALREHIMCGRNEFT